MVKGERQEARGERGEARGKTEEGRRERAALPPLQNRDVSPVEAMPLCSPKDTRRKKVAAQAVSNFILN